MFLITYLMLNPVIVVFGALSLFISTTILFAFLDGDESVDSSTASSFPPVSILIPAYNEGDVIKESIQNLLDLDYPEKEIVVIDDGSEDDTLERARKFEDGEEVKVFTKENGGKSSALNYGLERCSGELIFSLDADSFPKKDVLKKMVGYFEDEDVMAVVPTLKVRNPGSLLQRLQSVEYVITSFVRKVLSFMVALDVTPGAPLYRKEFFDRHGGFDETTITEDLEMGLRIHEKGYKVEHCVDGTVFTEAPDGFSGLKNQRVRWGYGTFENLSKYRNMFSPKYGDLGVFYLPVTLITAIMPVFFILYSAHGILTNIYKNIVNLSLVGFDFSYQLSSILSMPINFNMAHFIMAFMFFGGLITYFLARDKVEEGKFKAIYGVYIFGYLWALAFFQLIVVFRYLFKKNPGW